MMTRLRLKTASGHELAADVFHTINAVPGSPAAAR
jgi:hypothetical protein